MGGGSWGGGGEGEEREEEGAKEGRGKEKGIPTLWSARGYLSLGSAQPWAKSKSPARTVL